MPQSLVMCKTRRALLRPNKGGAGERGRGGEGGMKKEGRGLAKKGEHLGIWTGDLS